jgi:hypothetical protein
MLAYVGKGGDGSYLPFHYNTALNAAEIEISDDMFVITRETAEAYIEKQKTPEQVETGRGALERAYTQEEGPSITPGRQQRRWCTLDGGGKAHRGSGRPFVEWRGPGTEVDELLHQGAIQICDWQGAQASSFDRGPPG